MHLVLPVKMVLLDCLEDQAQREKQDPEENRVEQESKVILDYQDLVDNQEEMDQLDPQDPKESKEAKEREYVDAFTIFCSSIYFYFLVGCSRK